MTTAELIEQLDIETAAIERVLAELESLHRDAGETRPSMRDLAAAALFLTNFYNGVENILKRICRYHAVRIPQGDDWHRSLVRYFRNPPEDGLPLLLTDQLAEELAPFRRFRHVVYHGYGFQLRWEDMLPGIQNAQEVWESLRAAIDQYLTGLDKVEL